MNAKDRDAILDVVIDMLFDQFGDQEKTMGANTDLREDLGADSLDAVELMMTAEDKWQIEIKDEQAEACHTVGDIVSLIETCLAQQKPTAEESSSVTRDPSDEARTTNDEPRNESAENAEGNHV